MQNSPALEIGDLSRAFGKIRALDGVSLTVPRQSIFGLVGPNGAGKTTLFNIVAGFLRADEGSVRVLGTGVRGIARLLGRVSILPQDALFERNVPILDQLIFFRRLGGRSREQAQEEVKEALTRVGLHDYMERGVQVLSHGMVKRLGVAQAFLGDPELILLDEPTSGLDPRNARQIRDLIAGLRVTSTIVISSHNLAELQDLCDRVAILDHGRVVASGTMDEVTGGGRTVEMRLSRALEAAEKEQLLGLEGVGSIQERGSASYTVTLLGPEIDPEQAVERLLRVLLDLQITPRSLEAGSSLEETFLELTERPAESEE